ncbi:alpha/beta hydrolase [Homoserinimonas sp. A520]
MIEELGTELSPELIVATQQLFAPKCAPPDPSTLVERDIQYGPEERHRLDVFHRAATASLPVLVFVHGGGFVAGDKRSAALPFYGNIGQFAAREGFVGVTITYRLAPARPWPAGTEDIARVVSWLRAHISEYGGDPELIFVAGQSAGAVHVAGYVAHDRFHVESGAGIAGALLLSGIYDNAAAAANSFHTAYFGDDETAYPATSTLSGLAASDVPLPFSVSEFDVRDFQRQAALLVQEFAISRGDYPAMIHLRGHNHLSPVMAIGSQEDSLGPEIAGFMSATSGHEFDCPSRKASRR